MLAGGSAPKDDFSEEEYEEPDPEDWPPGKAQPRHRSTFLDRAALMTHLDSHATPLHRADTRPLLGEGRSGAKEATPRWATDCDAPGASGLQGGAHREGPSHSRPSQSRPRNRSAARQQPHPMDLKVRNWPCCAPGRSLLQHMPLTSGILTGLMVKVVMRVPSPQRHLASQTGQLNSQTSILVLVAFLCPSLDFLCSL